MKEFEVKTKGLGINPKDGLTEGLTGNADDASGIQTWVDLLKSIEKKLVQFVLEKNRLVLKIVPKGYTYEALVMGSLLVFVVTRRGNFRSRQIFKNPSFGS